MAPCPHITAQSIMSPCPHIITHMDMDMAPCLHMFTHMEPYYTL